MQAVTDEQPNGEQKRKRGRPRKDDAGARLNAEQLAKAAKDGDPQAFKALQKVVVCFEKWRKALDKAKDAKAKADELEGGAEAAFENAIEEPLPATADGNQVFGKLQNVEKHWQEVKDARAEATELRAEAKEKVKKAAKALEKATEDGAQLTLGEAFE
jgi:hypothetical protein